MGTYFCYTVTAKVSHLELSINGHKVRMIINTICSVVRREAMHREEDMEVKKLWNNVRMWFNITINDDIKEFQELYPKTFAYMMDRLD